MKTFNNGFYMKTVFCKRLGHELPALEHAPMTGEMGQIIWDNISAEAWNEWLETEIKIINEERLDLSEEKAQQRLFEQMINFLNLADLIDE